MKIYNELYNQLNHLISTVPSCNFIPYEDKKDIVQDVIVITFKRIEDGRLKEDFNEIKGYTFMTLQNACRAWHKKQTYREKPMGEFWEVKDTSTTSEDEEYKVYLHNIVKSYAQQPKYDDMDKRVIELLLENLQDKEIRDMTGLESDILSKHKFRVKTKLKFDFRRPVKYIIKNMFNKNIQVPCFSLADVKNYLKHIEPRRVTYMTTDKIISQDGFYVDVLIKRKRTKKGSSK